jgi:hypothetical protein
MWTRHVRARGLVVLAASAAFGLAPFAGAASASTSPPQVTVRIQGPILRVAGGAALLVRATVKCPKGYAVPEDASTGIAVTQTINPTRYEQSGDGFLFPAGIYCTGSPQVTTIPLYPPLTQSGVATDLPPLPWSLNRASGTADVTACDPTSNCLSAHDERIVSVRDATAAEESAGNHLPGTTITALPSVTRLAAGVQAKVHFQYKCTSGLPGGVFFETWLAQKTGSRPTIVNSPSFISTSPPAQCDGKVHQAATIVSPGTPRPWATGATFVMAAAIYCVDSGFGPQTCSASSSWRMGHLDNPSKSR